MRHLVSNRKHVNCRRLKQAACPSQGSAMKAVDVAGFRDIGSAGRLTRGLHPGAVGQVDTAGEAAARRGSTQAETGRRRHVARPANRLVKLRLQRRCAPSYRRRRTTPIPAPLGGDGLLGGAL